MRCLFKKVWKMPDLVMMVMQLKLRNFDRVLMKRLRNPPPYRLISSKRNNVEMISFQKTSNYPTTSDLQDAQRQYQQISIDDERLVKDYDAAKAESRALDLELSVVQNTLQEKETEVARLSELNESQAADFDQEKMKLDDEIVGATVLIQNLMNQLETDSNADDVASKEHERKLSRLLRK